MPRVVVTWSQLRVGAFVLGALAVLGVFLFYVTGAGAVFEPYYRLKTYLPDVSGLAIGAPVRVSGVEVGNVEGVRLSEFPEDPRRHAEVVFRVFRRYQKYILSDSEAFVTTEGLLGEGVLEITRGVSGEILPEGKPGSEAVVRGGERPSIKEVVYNAGVITDNIKDVMARISQGQGTLGKLIYDDALYRRIDATAENVRSLSATAAAGEGTVGKLMKSPELYDKLDRTANRLNTVAADLQAGKGTLGRLIYEDALHEEAKKFIVNANKVVEGIEAGKGTLGKLTTDDALYNRATKTFDNLQSLTGRMDEGEGTAGKIFREPQLYDNVNELTTELRALLSDFRKNPKKYLRIKVGLF